MKKIMAAIFFCLTFLGIGCNLTNGPDPSPIVSVNGTYERVYPVTLPEETQPVQIAFDQWDGAVATVNAKEVSENLYSFICTQLCATHPNGIVYKMRAFDYKLGDMYRVGKKFILNGYEFRGGDNGYVLFRLDKDETVYEVFD